MFSSFAVHEESPVSLVNRPLSFPVELGLLGKGGGGGLQKSTSLPNVAAGTSLQDVLRCLVLKGHTKGLASFSRVAMWLFFNLFCPERSLSETTWFLGWGCGRHIFSTALAFVMKVFSSFRESEAGLELFFEMNELPTRINVIEENKKIKKYWRFFKNSLQLLVYKHLLACVVFCFCFCLFLFVWEWDTDTQREIERAGGRWGGAGWGLGVLGADAARYRMWTQNTVWLQPERRRRRRRKKINLAADGLIGLKIQLVILVKEAAQPLGTMAANQ